MHCRREAIGDMTPREALAIPSGSGRDAVNPRN